MEFLGFIKDDWNKIPASARYIFYTGAFFIFVAWLGDRWNDHQQYHVLPAFFSNEDVFRLGVFVIIVFFVVLLTKQVWVFQKVLLLRRKYPLSDIDQTYNLVSLRGWVYLFSENPKERLHIKNWQTAADLGFVNEWQVVDTPKDAVPETEISFRNGTKIRLGEYPENHAGILTQGIRET